MEESLPTLSSPSSPNPLQSSPVIPQSLIISTVRSSIDGQDRASAIAIASLSSALLKSTIEEGLSFISSVLSDDLVLDLARCKKYSVRSRILELLLLIVEKFRDNCRVLKEETLIKVFVGFTIDIYPILRRGGVDGLCEVLSVAGNGVAFCVADKYCERFVVLLKDDDELVRSSAVRLVGLCGEIIAQKENGEGKSERINSIFVQICAMCRDMSKNVRIESFKALGKMNLVSESVLMQSLSKKLLKPKTGGKPLIKSETEKEMGFKTSFSCAAGAFIHGIEDEFYEVRVEACKSLGRLALLCIKFADGALNLLMDLSNDYYELIRLEALNCLYTMAIRGFLTMQDKHLEMFQGLLMDCSGAVRNSARKTIRLIKFPKFEKFKSIFNELVRNLEKHPNEEEDIFLTLFSLGKIHTKFSLKLAKDIVKQIEQSSKEELILDKPGVSCTIVLSLSSPFHNKQTACDTPAVLFSSAVPLFSRISKALKETIDTDSLLSFLLERIDVKMECNDLVGKDENEALSDEFKEFVNLILKNIGDIWPLIKSRKGYDVKRIIRGCMEELEMLSLDEDNTTGAIVEFVSQYVKIIQLISEIWRAINPKIHTSLSMKNLHILLEKLDSSLRKIKFSFTGLSKEPEFQILDLSLLSDLLKLSMVKSNSDQILNIIRVKISELESLSCVSEFRKEFKKLIDENNSHPIKLHDLLELFNLQELKFDLGIKSIKAKLEAVANDSENPIQYISGLPVGIKFHITLYNTSINNRIWIQMDVNGIFTEFIYLNLDKFEGSDELREFKNVNIPFYKTPKAVSFEIRVFIVMECLSEDNRLLEKGQGGPNYEVTELSDECIVYFVNKENK